MENTVKKIVAVAPPYPDGQKLDTLVIEYSCEIAMESVDCSKFQVKDRTIEAAYTSTRPERIMASENGRYVILELNLKDSRAKIIPAPQMGEKGVGRREPTEGVPNLPQQARREIKERVCQKEAVRCVDGGEIQPWEAESDTVVQPVINEFQQFTFEGIPYNLYIPKMAKMAGTTGAEMGQKYPLVVFLHDAGPNGADVFLTLAQGNGATSFASGKMQQKYPSFVLAPQIPKEVYLTSDDFTCAGEIETLKRMIDHVVENYPIEKKRIVYTGQSQGCMAGCELNVRYPGYFAASLLVAGPWNPMTVGTNCCHQKVWIFVSDGDRKACPGMTKVTEELEKNGAKVGRYHWNAKWPADQLNQAVRDALKDDCNIRFTIFDDHSVIPDGEDDNPGTNHMGTWPVVYSIDAVREWLVSQESTECGPEEQEPEEAVLEELDPKRLGMTGEDYLHGNHGLPQDYQKCYEYSKRAAQLGNVRSYTVLGILYRDGCYVEKDISRAMEYFDRATAEGDFKAPRFLGALYEEGDGVRQDYQEAFYWYQMAAERGDITAKFLLGRLYERGLGVRRDYRRAMELYLDSGSRGDVIAAPAIEAVARLYREGLGVQQDEQKAREWQNKYETARSTRLH